MRGYIFPLPPRDLFVAVLRTFTQDWRWVSDSSSFALTKQFLVLHTDLCSRALHKQAGGLARVTPVCEPCWVCCCSQKLCLVLSAPSELHFPEFVSIVVLAVGKSIIRLTSDYQRCCPYGFKNLSVIPNRAQTSSLLGKY